MTTRLPPRYLPTLTEVVTPQVRDVFSHVAAPVVQAAAVAQDVGPAETTDTADTVSPDRETLAQQVVALITPQLEAELRNVAQELFEAQYSAMLPSLHLQIEVAVRDAIDLALPTPVEHKD